MSSFVRYLARSYLSETAFAYLSIWRTHSLFPIMITHSFCKYSSFVDLKCSKWTICLNSESFSHCVCVCLCVHHVMLTTSTTCTICNTMTVRLYCLVRECDNNNGLNKHFTKLPAFYAFYGLNAVFIYINFVWNDGN